MANFIIPRWHHPHVALKRLGMDKYWCLFWFENIEEKELFDNKFLILY